MKTFTGEIPSRSQLQAWDDMQEELRQENYEEKGEWRLDARERAQMMNPPERWDIKTGAFQPNLALL